MIIARVQDLKNQERSYDYNGHKIRYTQAYWREIPDGLMDKMEADIVSGFLNTVEIGTDKSKFKKDEIPVCLDEKLQKHFPVKFFEIPKIVKVKEIEIKAMKKKEPTPTEPKGPGRPPKTEPKEPGEETEKDFDPQKAMKKKKK